MSLAQRDLFVKGRGFDFNLVRTYRSQTVGAGPFGPGWDHNYNLRLRELPDGSVEYFDRGRRELFEKQPDGKLKAPEGRFVSLERTAAGWILIDAQRNLARFDRFGRLVSLADAVKDSADTGNEMRFAYDMRSRLVGITDTLDRQITLSYDEEGRLNRLRDFDDREVTYEYDEAGRLTSVTSPKITVGESTYPNGLTTRYEYDPATGALAQALNQRDNLTAFSDARGNKRFDLTYTDADGDGRDQEVTSQIWGTGTVQIAYDFDARRATVTNRRGHVTIYGHNEDGQATQVEDAEGAVTSLEHNSDGLVTSLTEPLGRVSTYTYDTAGERRSQGNLLQLTVAADGRGANGSSGVLTTAYTYEGRTNQPTRIVGPRGTVTDITRDGIGQATSILRAAGLEEASEIRVSYNAFGQPTEVVNPNGHTTSYRYSATGEARGYLQSMTVDEGGLGITTQLETDARGNVTKVIDPRNIQHRRTWNEVDWPVEVVEPLGYRATYLYDENGNVTTERLPLEDGSSSTAVRYSYGALDEVLSIEREIEPGGSFVSEAFTYDASLNVIRKTEPEGKVTELTYDERDLPVQVVQGAGSAEAVTETTEYDLEGNPVSSTDGRDAVWRAVYDGYGRLKEAIDPLGTRAAFERDNSGNTIVRKSYDAGQQLLAHEEAAFDALDRQTVGRQKLWGGASGARDVESRMEYDASGNLVRVTDALGRVTQMTYDGAERLAAQTDPAGNHVELQLDAAGNITLRTAQERTPAGSVTVQVSAQYDELNRPVAVMDGMGNTSRSVYDVRGNLRLSINPENHVVAFTYDGLNRRTSMAQPAGITVAYDYDGSSRLVSYRDALSQETRWTYDPLDRRKATIYPDGTSEAYSYDGVGNLVSRTDARGTVIAQAFDLAGRLTGRTITPAAGVEGPVSESYVYDGLGRTLRAQSGDVVTEMAYDSLSRLVSETIAGKTVSYNHDDAGNPTRISYPSGHSITQTFDPLDLPQTINVSGAASSPIVSYGYRGRGLVASKDLGNGLTGARQFDLADRLIGQAFAGADGRTVFQESLSWNPRGLKIAQSRGDLNGAGFLLGYDDAGRLIQTGKSASSANVPNNGQTDPIALAGMPDVFGFTYDAAQNLLSRTLKTDGVATAETMPLDGSGRNRPGSVDGVPVEWDANGNLARKGDLRFHYDFQNRLTRVTGSAGQEVARYTYDAFNRRVSKAVSGTTRETVWSGWRPVEEYQGGQLASRRTYGADLDEIVRLENDLDGNGTVEAAYVPLYDDTGNLTVLTGTDGKPIERYVYSPYGERTVLVDSTPPAVEQVRVKQGALWIETSEEISLEALSRAIEQGKVSLVDTVTTQPIAVTATQPVQTGRQARRRLVLTLATAPETGDSLRLTLEPEALEDLFLNRPASNFQRSFTWPQGDMVLFDETSPKVQQVVVRDGYLEIELSEEPDLAAVATVIAVDGSPVTWTLENDRYTLKSSAALNQGTHSLAISDDALDLAGLGLEGAFDTTFAVSALTPSWIVYQAPDSREALSSATGNPFGFHGLPKDPETGLIYMRNRYYDPEMGRFISVDPLEYGDGPNLYQYGVNSPFNYSDPMGLEAADPETLRILRRVQAAADEAARMHGIRNMQQVLAAGDKGTDVHATLQKLLDRGGKYYHPRILTEVEVSANGTIFHHGVKQIAASGSIIKDIVILKPGMTRLNVRPGRTKAKQVTQLVVDLKIGKRGASLLQVLTLKRFGVLNLKLRPYGNLLQEYSDVLDDLRLLRRFKRGGKYILPALALFGKVLSAQEMAEAVEHGDPEEALKIMTGVDMFEDAATAAGNHIEDRLRNGPLKGAISEKEAKERAIDEIDNQ
ncbi:MAG TPA: RHS repeat-associated core domain-containing protein [Thermoanaerobaculia bacterium]